MHSPMFPARSIDLSQLQGTSEHARGLPVADTHGAFTRYSTLRMSTPALASHFLRAPFRHFIRRSFLLTRIESARENRGVGVLDPGNLSVHRIETSPHPDIVKRSAGDTYVHPTAKRSSCLESGQEWRCQHITSLSPSGFACLVSVISPPAQAERGWVSIRSAQASAG
jgi:hypothetical protein